MTINNIIETKEIDKNLTVDLSAILSKDIGDQQKTKLLNTFLESYNIIDIASNTQGYSRKEIYLIFLAIKTIKNQALFLIHTDRSTRIQLYKRIEDSQLASIFATVPNEEVVWMLDELIPSRHKRVMDLFSHTKQREVRKLENYDPESTGRLMNTQFFYLDVNITIGEAIEFIRKKPNTQLLRRLFVHGKQYELAGFVTARSLMINDRRLPLKKLVQPIDHVLYDTSNQDEIVDMIERYEIEYIPVLNKQNKMLGVIDYQDAIEIVEDLVDETIAYISGTSQDVSINDPIWKSFLDRAPWLLVTMGAGLVNYTVLTGFLEADKPPILQLLVGFIPLILGLSGNIGLQCSTILLRAQSMGQINTMQTRFILNEFKKGMAASTVFAFITGTFIYTLQVFFRSSMAFDPFKVTMICVCGVFSACLTSVFLGVSAPFAFRKVGVDPAVAAGPIVTALNDVTSTMIYFLVSTFISRLLGLIP